MHKTKPTNSFLQRIKQDNRSTLSTVQTLRHLNRSRRACEAMQGIHKPTAHGWLLRGLKYLLWLAWDELSLAGIWLQKFFWIFPFNSIGVSILIWLLSWI